MIVVWNIEVKIGNKHNEEISQEIKVLIAIVDLPERKRRDERKKEKKNI